MLPITELHFLVEHRVCGVEISDLPCLTTGHNSNLTPKGMADILRQGTAVDDENDPAPKNIPVTGNIILPQLEEENSWVLKGIFFPRQSNHLHKNNADFKSYLL